MLIIRSHVLPGDCVNTESVNTGHEELKEKKEPGLTYKPAIYDNVEVSAERYKT